MFAISKTWFWVPFTFRLHYQLLTLCLITRLVDPEVRISEGLAFSAGQTSSVSHTELDQDGCWTFLRKGSGYGRSSCNQIGSCVIKNHFTLIIWSKPHTSTHKKTYEEGLHVSRYWFTIELSLWYSIHSNISPIFIGLFSYCWVLRVFFNIF